jgi:isoaspartyl peptidase/L-asparaginase-like protein (Ntn-hydrolase superfamily)
LTSDLKGFDFGILIYGGASVEKIKRTNEITRSLKSAVYYGFDLLKRSSSNNPSAVDSVEAAVASMEDSGIFDAGIGAYLTIDKTVEMDASIMDGRDISAGSVGMATGIKNPVKLARKIMEEDMGLPKKSKGAVVQSVILGSPAYNAGLKGTILDVDKSGYLIRRGDVIISVDGHKVNGAEDMAKQMKKKHPGDLLSLVVNRNGQILNMVAKL